MNTKFEMWSLFPFIVRDIAVCAPASARASASVKTTADKSAGEPESVTSKDVAKIIRENMRDLVIRGLELFDEFQIITSSQIGELFGFKPRYSAQLCKNWVESGFLEIADFSNKNRKYRLSKVFQPQ